MNVRRGEIYYIKRTTSVGSEQEAGRPAIVVSNFLNNSHSEIVEVVYLTTQLKKNLPTHVKILASGRESTALCEQISTVSSERIGDYIGTCSSKEIQAINDAMLVSLGISEVFINYEGALLEETTPDTAVIERDIYKRLYEQLLDKIMRGDKHEKP